MSSQVTSLPLSPAPSFCGNFGDTRNWRGGEGGHSISRWFNHSTLRHMLIQEINGQSVCCKNTAEIQGKPILRIEVLKPIAHAPKCWLAAFLLFLHKARNFLNRGMAFVIFRGRWRAAAQTLSVSFLSATAGVLSAEQPRFLQPPEKLELGLWGRAPV